MAKQSSFAAPPPLKKRKPNPPSDQPSHPSTTPDPEPNEKEKEESEEEEEEDYLTLALPPSPPPNPRFETPTARRQRLARLRAANAHPLPKATLLAQAASTRDTALATPLDLSASSKGFRMMAAQGFMAGGTLGKEGNPWARSEPVGVVVREGRVGLGLGGEKKIGASEEVGGKRKGGEGAGVEAVMVDDGEGFRERVGREREERRLEGLVGGAGRVLEGFEEEAEEAEEEHNGGRKRNQKKKVKVNVLYRGLVREREERERERRARGGVFGDEEKKGGYAREVVEVEDGEDGEGGEDEELEAFEKLGAEERLGRIVAELRERWWYCFWCKVRYGGAGMEGCPGEGEEDHD